MCAATGGLAVGAALAAVFLCWVEPVSAQGGGAATRPSRDGPRPMRPPAPIAPEPTAPSIPSPAQALTQPQGASELAASASSAPDRCAQAIPRCGMVFALEEEFPNLTERKRLYAECRASWGCADAERDTADLPPLRHRALARLRAFGGWPAARFLDAFSPQAPPHASFDNQQAGTASRNVHPPVVRRCAARLPEQWGNAAREIKGCFGPLHGAAVEAHSGGAFDGNGFRRPLSSFFAGLLETDDTFHQCVRRAVVSRCVADLWEHPSYALTVVTAPVNHEVTVHASGDLGFTRVMKPDEAFVAPRDVQAHFLVMAPLHSVLTLSEGSAASSAARDGRVPLGEDAHVERRLVSERYDAVALSSVLGGGRSSAWRCLDLTVTGEEHTAVYIDGSPVDLQPVNLSERDSSAVEGRALYHMQARKNRRAIRLNVVNTRPGGPAPVLYSQTLDFDSLSTAKAKDGCAPLEVDVTNLERVILLPVRASPSCSVAGVDASIFYQRMAEYLKLLHGDDFVDIQSWSRTLAQVESLASESGPTQQAGPIPGMTTSGAPPGADRGRVSTTGIMGAYGAEQFRQGFKYIYSADLACNPRSDVDGSAWDFTVVAHRTNVEASLSSRASDELDEIQRSHSLTVKHQLEVLDLIRVPLAALSGTGFSRFRSAPKEVWDFKSATLRLDSDSREESPTAAHTAKNAIVNSKTDHRQRGHTEHEFGWWNADALFPDVPNPEAEMEHMCREIDGRAVGREESWADRIQTLQGERRQRGGWRPLVGYRAEMRPSVPGIHVIGTRTLGVDVEDSASFRCVRVRRPAPRFMLEASLARRAFAPGQDAHLGSVTRVSGQVGYWYLMVPKSPLQVGSALGYGITFHAYGAPPSWDDFASSTSDAIDLQGRLNYAFTRHSLIVSPAVAELRPFQWGRWTPWLRMVPVIVDLGWVDASELPSGLSHFVGGEGASKRQFDFDVGAVLALGIQIRLNEGNAVSPFIGVTLNAWDDLLTRGDRNTVLDDGGISLGGGITWSL